MSNVDQKTQNERREAWRQANASVRMEKGVVDDETLAMQEKQIAGDISFAEYMTWVAATTKA